MPNLLRVILFDDVDRIEGTVPSQSYASFLNTTPHSPAGARRAANLVIGDDTINLQFTSGTVSSRHRMLIDSNDR